LIGAISGTSTSRSTFHAMMLKELKEWLDRLHQETSTPRSTLFCKTQLRVILLTSTLGGSYI
jgi:hypothetical protein